MILIFGRVVFSNTCFNIFFVKKKILFIALEIDRMVIYYVCTREWHNRLRVSLSCACSLNTLQLRAVSIETLVFNPLNVELRLTISEKAIDMYSLAFIANAAANSNMCQ